MALQVLYQLETAPHLSAEEALGLYFALLTVEPLPSMSTREFTERMVRGVITQKLLLDDHIQRASQHWRLDRMTQVDRSILRIATYEILYEPETPHTVVLNEAIELAKRFGTEESASFVNGVLDRVVTNVRGTR